MKPAVAARLVKKHGSIKAAARAGEGTFHEVRTAYAEAVKKGLADERPSGGGSSVRSKRYEEKIVVENSIASRRHASGQLKAKPAKRVPVPREGVRRHIFTVAQNATKVHAEFWENLVAFATYMGAKIHVARCTYKRDAYKSQYQKNKLYSKPQDELWWDAAVVPFLDDGRLEIAPGLIWCGDMDILPTAVRPLSGLEAYTGRKSGIFPHVKIALETVASGRNEGTKFNYTTGAVTQRNYIQRKTGMKAEFHHCYGALLVEVTDDGTWFARQLNADSTGRFYDLNVEVNGGQVTEGMDIEAINWGDIHAEEIEPDVAEMNWGEGGILDTLLPNHQFMHDVMSFRARSHHEVKDHMQMYRRYVEGSDKVSGELEKVEAVFEKAHRDWCKSVVVGSNHHDHLGRWLKEQDARKDPANLDLWLALNTAACSHIKNGVPFQVLRHALLEHTASPFVDKATWLLEDESYIICPDAGGGVECGMHGHLGPNGARGGSAAFARMGRKANVGHSHSPRIQDGVYTAGTCGTLTPEWTHGPSSWSWSHIVTYQNGKRAILTLYRRKDGSMAWRA